MDRSKSSSLIQPIQRSEWNIYIYIYTTDHNHWAFSYATYLPLSPQKISVESGTLSLSQHPQRAMPLTTSKEIYISVRYGKPCVTQLIQNDFFNSYEYKYYQSTINDSSTKIRRRLHKKCLNIRALLCLISYHINDHQCDCSTVKLRRCKTVYHVTYI